MTDFFLRFANHPALFVVIPLLAAAVWWRWRYKRAHVYRYSLTGTLVLRGATSTHPYKKILFFIRLIMLALLALLIARPQLVDPRSKIDVRGIDIMLVLDASGSMGNQDYADDARSRFDVAKEEATRFIEKRTHDALGLVLFGNEAISRCPLTMDKKSLLQMTREINLGDVDREGTLLATAVVTAVNRLKLSQAKSKVMILLTDGEPSEGDLDPAAAIAIAKQYGIKVYAIGIGSEEDQVFVHPLFGMVRKPRVNKELLETIAKETGGQCFMARNAQDMRAVYDTIDRLEKSEQEMPLFSRYYDLFVPFACIVLALMVIELALSTFVWFGL